MLAFFKSAFAWFGGLPQLIRVATICLAIGFLVGGLTCRTWRKAVIESDERGMGWIDDPNRVKAVVATFANPYFGDSGSKLVQAAKDEDALLYKAFEKATGRPWQAHDQNGTGCCVGEGNSGAVELLSAIEIALGEQDQEFKPISAAAVYALAREVGHDLGNQDGAVGADAAKALMTFGALSCEEASDTDGRDGTAKEHGALAKKWGRTGLPSELKKLAKGHLVKTASQVRTPEEVRAALVNGYPVTICSSVGFEPFRRDADGFCKPGGTWPHCMFIGGYRADKKGFLVFQSWGSSSPPGPKALDQPDGTFWITWTACQRIVTTGECYALSAFDGYKSRDLPLFIQAPMPRREFARPTFALAP